MPRPTPAARAPRKRRPRPARPKERGVEERTLPDGSWERVFHGESMKDPLCVKALRETGDRSRQRHLDSDRVRVRAANDAVASVLEVERATELEQKGQLRATHDVTTHGHGPGRPGCDGCRAYPARLRYVEGEGFLCADCRALSEERRERGLARCAV